MNATRAAIATIESLAEIDNAADQELGKLDENVGDGVDGMAWVAEQRRAKVSKQVRK